jgi:hypothetical protein
LYLKIKREYLSGGKMKKTFLLSAVILLLLAPLSAQTITVTWPNGSRWCIGSNYAITWMSSGVTGNVDIILRQAGAPSAPPVLGIAAGTANDGSEGWTVPPSVAPGKYLVRIRSVDSPEVFDDSVDFEIKDCSAPYIDVFLPKAGTFNAGVNCSIQWQSTGVTGNVDIILRPANQPSAPPVMGIASGSANDGLEGWTIPASLVSGSYLIRVRSVNSPGVYGDSQIFEINGIKVISHLPQEPVPPIKFKFPRLAVSDIDLVENADGFGIIFSYKNVGDAPLPKASEVPVKSNYRVLIDGKEMTRGFLTIPTFPAPPGWQQWGYFGGWIVLPSSEASYNTTWHIGNTIAVYINENKVMGMDSHSLTLNLKPIALKYKWDLVCNGYSLDWSTGVLTVHLRLDGNVPAGRELLVYCGNYVNSNNYFLVSKPAKPGTYVVSKKLNITSIYATGEDFSFYLNSFVTNPDAKHVWDMDYRNNGTIHLKFKRPNPNPIM